MFLGRGAIRVIARQHLRAVHQQAVYDLTVEFLGAHAYLLSQGRYVAEVLGVQQFFLLPDQGVGLVGVFCAFPVLEEVQAVVRFVPVDLCLYANAPDDIVVSQLSV